eukprot:gnl/TRDRNA2_/TRDRNA2_197907_c0_seq1.p1 gnl/TRDRNA2_/TRDRNA2_197907_c0~~gnl/TRDRNA2_/TRDRNA2_197907_c0_seq1.p1  ORF type:complete len:240 (+),score=54.54 gnl/TRDRNA2_/TRDRNA2_197907_c0_seq1:45-722(+)
MAAAHVCPIAQTPEGVATGPVQTADDHSLSSDVALARLAESHARLLGENQSLRELAVEIAERYNRVLETADPGIAAASPGASATRLWLDEMPWQPAARSSAAILSQLQRLASIGRNSAQLMHENSELRDEVRRLRDAGGQDWDFRQVAVERDREEKEAVKPPEAMLPRVQPADPQLEARQRQLMTQLETVRAHCRHEAGLRSLLEERIAASAAAAAAGQRGNVNG